jgi:hypothetical protein
MHIVNGWKSYGMKQSTFFFMLRCLHFPYFTFILGGPFQSIKVRYPHAVIPVSINTPVLTNPTGTGQQ